MNALVYWQHLLRTKRGFVVTGFYLAYLLVQIIRFTGTILLNLGYRAEVQIIDFYFWLYDIRFASAFISMILFPI